MQAITTTAERLNCPAQVQYGPQRGSALICAQQQQRVCIHTHTCIKSAISRSSQERMPKQGILAYLTKRAAQTLQCYLAAEVDWTAWTQDITEQAGCLICVC